MRVTQNDLARACRAASLCGAQGLRLEVCEGVAGNPLHYEIYHVQSGKRVFTCKAMGEVFTYVTGYKDGRDGR